MEESGVNLRRDSLVKAGPDQVAEVVEAMRLRSGVDLGVKVVRATDSEATSSHWQDAAIPFLGLALVQEVG